MEYKVRFSESISDVVLNSTGDITNWDGITAINFFSSWTPTLTADEIVQIPDSVNINNSNLSVLNSYPANNAPLPGVFDQFYSIFQLLKTVIPAPIQNAVLPQVDTNVYYAVRPLESIGDWVLNSTGSITNWNLIAQQNFWDTWTPFLNAGDKVAIPSTVAMSLNNYRSLNTYPANNHSVDDIYDQINTIFDILNENLWILHTNFWNDGGIWIDTAFWQD